MDSSQRRGARRYRDIDFQDAGNARGGSGSGKVRVALIRYTVEHSVAATPEIDHGGWLYRYTSRGFAALRIQTGFGLANHLAGSADGSTVVQIHRVSGNVQLTRHDSQPTPPPARGLPPAPRWCFNRTAERARLTEWLDASTGPCLVVLSGASGVGTTTLALHAAYQIAERFPDGHLHAVLSEAGSDTASVVETVLSQFLVALGLPADRLPAGRGALVALYRSWTAHRRVLVVLDDAPNAALVRLLLPASPHSCVLVTSRSRLTGLVMDGARHLPVDTLDRQHCVDVLRAAIGGDLVDADPDAAARVVAYCGGLPLLVMIAAAMVVTGVCPSLSDVAARLARPSGVLDFAVEGTSLGDLMDLSYRALSDRAQAIYRMAGLFPGCLNAAVLSAVLPATETDIQAALDGLVEMNLLNPDHHGRYRVPDLVRQHAHKMALAHFSAAEREMMTESVARWYLDLCVAADRTTQPHRHVFGPAYQLHQPNRDRGEWAIAQVRRDRDAIVGVLIDVAAAAGPEGLGWQMSEPLGRLLILDGLYHLACTVFEVGAADARRLGHPFHVVALIRLALTLHRMEMTQRAEQQCAVAGTALDEHRDQWSPDEVNWISGVLAQVHGGLAEARDDFAAAESLYRQALEVARHRYAADPLSTGEGVAERVRAVASVQARQGNVVAAHATLDEASRITLVDGVPTGNPHAAARVLALRGRIFFNQADYRAAWSAQTQAQALLTSASPRRWRLDLHVDLAETADRLADRDSAITHLTAAWELATADHHHELAADLSTRITELTNSR